MDRGCVCVVCDDQFARLVMKGNYHQRYKICDRCVQWHKWCPWQQHAPLRSQFDLQRATKDQLQDTCRTCLIDKRGSIRIYRCEHCWDEFVVWRQGSRFNGRGLTLCDDCYATVKHCKNCDTFKPRSEFGISRDKRNGLVGSCMECNRQKWHALPASRRALPKLAKFGLTYDEYSAMRVACNDLCEICGRPETYLQNGKVKPLAIDHCHTTGIVRGLLCHACNAAIGYMADDPERLRAAADYLERSRKLTAVS